MKNEDQIIKMLEYYVEKHYLNNDLPDMFHCKETTALWYKRSYQIWSANEILNMLKLVYNWKRSYLTIEDYLMDIRHMFDDFAMKNKPNTQMFVEAYEVVTDLLDFVISIKTKGGIK